MTIRYEANPPKILPDVNLEESKSKFIEKIRLISQNCDAVHLTENVLGYKRVSPIEIGKRIRKEIPDLPLTVSMRVRDKNEREIHKFVEDSISAGFSGILVLMGDPPKDGSPDSGQIPSRVVKELREKGIDSKIDLYLSIPNKPDFAKIEKKTDAKPKGFMTQVVQNLEQVQNIVNNLSKFDIIPIVLFPSEKNEKSANFLKLDLKSYGENFMEFVKKVEKVSGDVLITSPNDFAGVEKFLRELRS